MMIKHQQKQIHLPATFAGTSRVSAGKAKDGVCGGPRSSNQLISFCELSHTACLRRHVLNCCRCSRGHHMPLVSVLGYAASAAVLATFCMNTMTPLRVV